MRDGGKGDLRRPLVVSEETFNNNWDAIFGKKDALTPNQELGVKLRKMIDDAPISKTLNANLEPIPFAGMVNTDEV